MSDQKTIWAPSCGCIFMQSPPVETNYTIAFKCPEHKDMANDAIRNDIMEQCAAQTAAFEAQG